VQRGLQADLIALVVLALFLIGYRKWLQHHSHLALLCLMAWSGLAVIWAVVVMVRGNFTTERGGDVHTIAPAVHPILYWYLVAGVFLAAMIALALAIGRVIGNGSTAPPKPAR
jgi:hypothetical protein